MSTFAGLDCDQFPGIAALSAIASDTNIAWVGFYLTAPSHSNAGWSGNLAAIKNLGLATAPIYVGQQVTGPGSHNVTAAQGTLDGLDCAAKMASEGFPLGSFAYLDLENGPPLGVSQSDYVSAWVAALEGAGWGPGVYCSHLMAHAVAAANPTVRIWAFNIPSIARTVAVYPFPTPDPSLSGYSSAVIWQREQNVSISGPGFSLVVDLDTSSLADPSLPIANGVAAGLAGVVNPVAPTMQLVQPSPLPAPPATSNPPTAGAAVPSQAAAPTPTGTMATTVTTEDLVTALAPLISDAITAAKAQSAPVTLTSVLADAKPFIQSKTVWAAALAGVAIIAQQLGYNLTSGQESDIINAATGIIAGISSIAAIVFRITATRSLK